MTTLSGFSGYLIWLVVYVVKKAATLDRDRPRTTEEGIDLDTVSFHSVIDDGGEA
jgi:hypothetical protein